LNQEELAKADEELLSIISKLELYLHLYLRDARPEITPKFFRLFYSQLRRLFNQLFDIKIGKLMKLSSNTISS
jgi:hypothetical protein